MQLGRWHDPAVRLRGGDGTDREHAFWLDAGPGATDGWSWVGTGVARGRSGPHPGRCRAPRRRRRGLAGRAASAAAGWAGSATSRRRAPPAPRSALADGAAPADCLAPGRALRRVRSRAAAGVGRGCRPTRSKRSRTRSMPLRRRPSPPVAPAAPLGTARARHLPAEYAGLIERCRDAIREGDAYQLCLTTRFSVDAPRSIRSPSSGACARRHRRITADSSGRVTSRSPARAPSDSSRSTTGIVRTHPIKGTRPRGADAAEDRATRGRAPREREGARRERHDRRPDAQRPLARLRARDRSASTGCWRSSPTRPSISS